MFTQFVLMKLDVLYVSPLDYLSYVLLFLLIFVYVMLIILVFLVIFDRLGMLGTSSVYSANVDNAVNIRISLLRLTGTNSIDQLGFSSLF